MSRVRYSEEAVPAPTEARRAALRALAKRPDSDIDFSDLPPLTEDFWQDAARGRFYRPVKKATSVRIDMDVLDWLKKQGKGYQTRINLILRDAMLRSMQQPRQTGI